MSQGTTGYAPVNGLRMYYEVHGTGRPLVLLHGGLMTIALSFGGLRPELAADRQVIATELQGHGRTADIDRDIDLRYLAGDVAALLDHLGIGQADVLGFSLGDRLAPDPGHFDAFAAKTSQAAGNLKGWTAGELGRIGAPTLLVFGDHDFIRLEHAVEMQGLIPGAQLAVLPGATHMDVLRRADLIVPLV